MQQYIRRLVAKNYGCLKDVKVELTPLHAFIGPNDSGKSTLLDAARVAVEFATHTEKRKGSIPTRVNRLGLFNEADRSSLEIQQTPVVGYRISRIAENITEELLLNGEVTKTMQKEHAGQNRLDLGSIVDLIVEPNRHSLTGSWLVRFDPDEMRTPCRLIPDEQAISFQNERGKGLASVYDAIITRGDDSFQNLSEKVRTFFPSVHRLRMFNTDGQEKILGVELKDGTLVRSDRMSEGLLFYLGFVAIEKIDTPSLILVEEPENGLHPARIAAVIQVLREVSKTTQVLIATHSPLVINEMKPDEVTVVTRDPEKGTKTIRINKTEDFEGRAKIYALGELWLSYADGDKEKPLIEGVEPLE